MGYQSRAPSLLESAFLLEPFKPRNLHPKALKRPPHNRPINLGRLKQGVSEQGVMTFAWRPGITVRCHRDARCRQCSGKRLSRTIWSSSTAQRDNVLASECKYPLSVCPPLNLPDRSPLNLFFGFVTLLGGVEKGKRTHKKGEAMKRAPPPPQKQKQSILTC